MMGTVQEAVDTVFANPRGYESLYRALTNGARPSDVEEWLRWEGEALDHALPDDQQKAMARQSEVSSRLKKTVKSKLNSFRSYTSDSWQNWNELATSCIGVLIMFFGLVFSAWSTTGREFSLPALAGSFKLGMIPIALGTGILLPYVKDLLGTVRR